MKIFKLLIIGILMVSMVGCIDTVTRLWNSGPYISEKESKAYDVCYKERRERLPDLDDAMENNRPMSVESIRQYNNYLEECMKRQGF